MTTWDEAYLGNPPWETGRPQPAFLKLFNEGKIEGSVLDAGCGTGDQAILFASRGNAVLGIDFSRRAVELARSKAKSRRSHAEFLVWDALDLGSLGRRFDTVTDCGLFHTFPDDERGAYVSSLGKAVKPGGSYFMLCFSELEPTDWGGPRRVTRDEIAEAFSDGWRLASIVPSKFDTLLHEDGGKAWLASLVKTPEGSLR